MLIFKHIDKKYRINNQIRVPRVRVIDENGEQLGVLDTNEAITNAQAKGFDLVEVSPKAEPPVCKIMDFGQMLYQQNKQKQAGKKKQKASEVKGIRLSYNMGQHDIDMRVKQTNKFLEKGNKVKVEMILRGRQKAHPEHVHEVFSEFMDKIETPFNLDQNLKRMGHKMMVVLTPVKK